MVNKRFSDKKGNFFLSVLMPIVFISAIIGILRYIKILPLFMKAVGLGLSKINGMGKLESYNGVACALPLFATPAKTKSTPCPAKARR